LKKEFKIMTDAAKPVEVTAETPLETPAVPAPASDHSAVISKEHERLAALKKRFPTDLEFVLEQFAQGSSVEQAVAEMKRRVKRLAPGEIDPDDEEDLRAKVAGLLKPGELPDNRPLPELIGVGQCDGVIYFGKGAKAVPLNDDEYHVVAIPSLQREALRYLRPMPKSWHALQAFHSNGARYTGTSRPSAHFLISPSMQADSDKAKRPLEWIFTQDSHCIDATQPEHRGRFRVFKVEEGIWAVLYL
jgi:hypothetical protein